MTVGIFFNYIENFPHFTLLTIHLHVVTGESLQHYEAEEPKHGRGPKEEISNETPSGGESGGQENIVCQLYRHL